MGSVQEDFDGIFQHMQEYKIIVCNRCVFALVPQQIDRHLREHHPQIDKQNRSRIVERARTLEAVAHNKEDVEYPQAGEEPVEGLEVFKDGPQCTGQQDGNPCEYVCRTAFGMQKHCQCKASSSISLRTARETRRQYLLEQRGVFHSDLWG